MEKVKGKQNAPYVLILVLIIIFILKCDKFLNTEGSEHPLLETLFDMIIILAALILIYHKNELFGEQNGDIKQTYIDNYFKKKKRIKYKFYYLNSKFNFFIFYFFIFFN